MIVIFLLLAIFTSPALGTCLNGTVLTVPGFEPSRYLGFWYEIGRSRSLISGSTCAKTFVQYRIIDPRQGTVFVNSTCRRQGVWRSAIGEAVVVEGGRFEVSSLGPFYGTHDVVYVTDDYSVGLIISCSTQGKPGMWILSREPEMKDSALAGYLGIFEKKGFHPLDFVRTDQ